MKLPALADLHRHLDGSLRPGTVAELASCEGMDVPENLVFFPRMGINAALARFAFTLSLMQSLEALRRVAREACEDAIAEGVTTLEIRFAPQLHGQRGRSIYEVTEAALEGIAGRAGLILCGLYGEPPAVLRALVDVARGLPGVVGIDLAGAPSPGHMWSVEHYQSAYTEAERMGLGRTVHAGEGRDAAEIRDAIELLHAQRIGHGTTLLDDPALTDLVIERGVTLEACLTSNVHTGSVASVQAHPIARWLSLGVRACVCTDNTLFSAVSAPEEHRHALGAAGMTEALLLRAIECGHRGAFARRHLAGSP